MRPITALSLVIAVANVICNCHGALALGDKTGKYPTRPEIFDLNLFKDNKFIRTCRGAELTHEDTHMWITAAECLDSEKYDQIEVKFRLLGKFDQVKFNLGGDNFQVHPDYNKTTKEHNIGLITPLLDYVDKDPVLRRIQLPQKGESFVGQIVNVFLKYKTTNINDGKTETYKIESIRTRIIETHWCDKRFPFPLKNNICTNGFPGKLLHKYDIGTPLVLRENDDTFKLVGIASKIPPWGKQFRSPMEFLHVDAYLDWIRSFQ